MKVVEATADRLVVQYQSERKANVLILFSGFGIPICFVVFLAYLTRGSYFYAFVSFLALGGSTVLLIVGARELRTIRAFNFDKVARTMTFSVIRDGRTFSTIYPLQDLAKAEFVVTNNDGEPNQTHLYLHYRSIALRPPIRFNFEIEEDHHSHGTIATINRFLESEPKVVNPWTAKTHP